MINLFFKLFIHSVITDKWFSILNVLGLATGLCCSLFIFLWVNDELSFDDFHKSPSSIYRIVTQEKISDRNIKNPFSPSPLAIELRTKYPQIKSSVSIYGSSLAKYSISSNDNILKCNVQLTTEDFFDIFNFPFTYRSSGEIFINEYSAVLSKTCAELLFGHENPIGQYIEDSFHELKYQITAVIDIPENSHLKFDILVPFSSNKTINKVRHQWGVINTANYIKLHEDASFTKKQKLEIRYILNDKMNTEAQLFFQPLLDIHLFTDFNDDFSFKNGNIENVRAFSIASFLLIFITGLNFILLSIARSENRKKEIGLKKIYGLKKNFLIGQLIIETILFTLIAQLVTLVLFYILQPYVNEFTNKDFFLRFNITSVSYFIFSLLLISLLSGCYLFFYLPSLKPINIIKGVSIRGSKYHISKIIAPIQLMITLFFIIFSLHVYMQLKYMQTKNLGINFTNVVSINTQGFIYEYDVIKAELLKNPNIFSVTASGRAPIDYNFEKNNVKWSGCEINERNVFGLFVIDPSFASVFEIEILQGSNLPKDMSINDHFNGKYLDNTPIIINEAAAKTIGLENIIGKRIDFGYAQANGYICGIAKDFNFKSLKNKIAPMAMVYDPESFQEIFVRFNPDTYNNVLEYIEKVTKHYRDERYAFEHYLLKDKLNQTFSEEKRIQKFAFFFAIISITLSLLGLVAMILYSINRERKNIAIKKIYGANTINIIYSYTKESVMILLLAFIAIIPIVIVVLHKWLEDYAYHIPISSLLFLEVLLSATIIVSILSIALIHKEATQNPIDNLRQE